jgi:hypothetical protein
MLAGFTAPADLRLRVDAVIVPVSQAAGLARQIAELWPAEDGGDALGLAMVEGFAASDNDKHLWERPGSEFLPWRARTGNDEWLDAAWCSFWWD